MMLSLTVLVTLSLFAGVQSIRRNEFDQKLKFKCDPNEYISSWKSRHSNKYEDRVFDIDCKEGIVGTECQWTPNWQNNFDGKLEYKCPKNYVLAGAESEHANWQDDRRWKFRCCKVAESKGEECIKTDYTNELDKEGELVLEPRQAIHGVYGYHSNRHEDRRYGFYVCSYAECTAKKITILDKLVPKKKGLRQVGFTTSIGCTPGKQYTLKLGKTDTVEETTSITIKKGREYSYKKSVSVTGTAVLGAFGAGIALSIGKTDSYGQKLTASKSTAKQTMTGYGSSAGIDSQFHGPGAALIIGEVTEYEIDRSDVNVKVDVECTDGRQFSKWTTMGFKSKTYSQTHFTTQTGSFIDESYYENCSGELNECLRNMPGHFVQDPYKIIGAFEKCFEGVGYVSK